MADKKPIVVMKGITIEFPGVKALDGVNLRLFPGEVHALMGENGAGKSTMIKALTGVYKINAGSIEVDGKPQTFTGTGDAQNAGIATVYQEVNLCTNLTIGENSYQVVTSNPDLVGMSAPFSLSSAPVMTNGKTYVPIELFVPLTGNDSSIIKTDGSAISISKKADTKNEDVQIPNPLTEHETLADLAKTVGFDVTLPTLDKAYKETAFIDISGTTADVRFADGEDTITFRKAKGSDDISGDNKTYKENKTIAVKDVSVSVKGNDGINTATWQKDGFTYSFSSDKAMTQDALVKAIENLF